MFMSVQIRHLQGGHLITAFPGWWPHQTCLEQIGQQLSVMQGLTEAFGLWLDSLSTLLILPFIYNGPQSICRLMDRLYTALAGHNTGLDSNHNK